MAYDRPVAAFLEKTFHWKLYRALALYAIGTCVFVAACDVYSWLAYEGHSPISDTISSLAAGPHSGLLDLGMVVFASGILALTIAFILRGDGQPKAWWIRGALFLLMVDIVAMALHNEYGDGDRGGLVIHNYLVVLWGILVPLILWFTPSVPPAGKDRLTDASRTLAVVWALTAPFLHYVPEAIMGLYERGLVLAMLIAVSVAAWRLFEGPRRAARQSAAR